MQQKSSKQVRSNNIIFVVIGIAVAAVIGASAVYSIIPQNNTPQQVYDQNILYHTANVELKESLKNQKISMSSPIKIKGPDSLEKYCTFFVDEQKQSMIEYCTSTELLNSESAFLGNIHMVGSPDTPKLVIAIIQTDPFMSEINDVKTVFRITIENLVCDCWADVKPAGFDSINSWIDGIREFHSSEIKPTSKSKLVSLADKKLQIELTTNTDGYLWKLFIEN